MPPVLPVSMFVDECLLIADEMFGVRADSILVGKDVNKLPSSWNSGI